MFNNYYPEPLPSIWSIPLLSSMTSAWSLPSSLNGFLQNPYLQFKLISNERLKVNILKFEALALFSLNDLPLPSVSYPALMMPPITQTRQLSHFLFYLCSHIMSLNPLYGINFLFFCLSTLKLPPIQLLVIYFLNIFILQ